MTTLQASYPVNSMSASLFNSAIFIPKFNLNGSINFWWKLGSHKIGVTWHFV